jgi:hypothetical protein
MTIDRNVRRVVAGTIGLSVFATWSPVMLAASVALPPNLNLASTARTY